MQANGARATPEQWGHIYQYFLSNLTLLNPNRADEEELSDVLGVDEKTAIEIVRRHYDKPFDSAADLESVAGVNKARVEKLKDRLLFDQGGRGR
jgi:DNA uptake protein ComE-like DNA-binding protein